MLGSQVVILITIAVYLIAMVLIGVYFGKKGSGNSSDDFYLGGRKMGPLVTAMSAEASDMSSYLLMGLPGLAYLCGLPEVSWTCIGLAIGTYLNWLIVARRLRRYSARIGAITVPDFFSRRYGDKKNLLSAIAAVVILVFFIPYTASGFKAVGTLFNSLFGFEYHTAMIIGAVVIGIGQGVVVRQQATTGGTDIVAMLLQKFAGIKFSTGILLADGFVVLSGLAVIGFGLGTGDAASNGWMLTLYSLITIYITSRVIAYLLNGASYDKLLFIISDHHEQLKRFIIEDLDRSATYIKSKGMYTDALRDMIFLVVSRKEVRLVQHKIKEIDPSAFVVVTDAYETFGEGFKQFPDKNEIHAE